MSPFSVWAGTPSQIACTAESTQFTPQEGGGEGCGVPLLLHTCEYGPHTEWELGTHRRGRPSYRLPFLSLIQTIRICKTSQGAHSRLFYTKKQLATEDKDSVFWRCRRRGTVQGLVGANTAETHGIQERMTAEHQQTYFDKMISQKSLGRRN